MVARTSSESSEAYNLEAERNVLGACLLHPDAVPEVAAILSASDFYLPRHQLIFQAILASYNGRHATDVIVVGEALSRWGRLQEAGGHELLLDLLEGVVTAVGVGNHAGIVRDHARRRNAIDAGRALIGALRNGGDVTEEIERFTAATATGATSSGSTLPLLSLADLAAVSQRQQLVEGLIFSDSLNAFCGPQKHYKTVLADDLVRATVEGGAFLGHRVLHPGLGIDFSLEGMSGKGPRYRAHLGVPRFNDPTDPVQRRLFLSPVVPDITTTQGQDVVLRTIERVCKQTGEPLRLLKFDTVARAMSSARLDENSTEDMGAWIAGLDRIRAKFPCAQVLVHHTGKNGLERGSTALPGAVDLLAFVRKTAPNEARVAVRDARDIEVPPPWTVRFASVVVGTYENGQHITALRVDGFDVVPGGDDPGESAEKATARDALHTLAEESGVEGFTFKQAKDAAARANATVSKLLNKTLAKDLQKFRDEDGKDRWRMRPR